MLHEAQRAIFEAVEDVWKRHRSMRKTARASRVSARMKLSPPIVFFFLPLLAVVACSGASSPAGEGTGDGAGERSPTETDPAGTSEGPGAGAPAAPGTPPSSGAPNADGDQPASGESSSSASAARCALYAQTYCGCFTSRPECVADQTKDCNLFYGGALCQYTAAVDCIIAQNCAPGWVTTCGKKFC